MAKIYSPPAEAGDPPAIDPKIPIKDHLKAEAKWVEGVQALARGQADNPEVVGEVVHFPRGDGYASYVVWRAKPLQLVHLPIGDRWHIDPVHARGLRLSDIEQQIRRNKNPIFGRSS